MKKKLMILASVACMVCLSAVMLAGCSGGAATDKKAEGESAPAASSTTFTVGFDQDFPPYGYVGDDGKLTGFDLDLAKEVCARNGWECKLEPINWDTKDTLINSGSISCIWNGFTMEGRENDYTFAGPYMDNSQVVVAKKSSNITDFAGLKDKVVLAQADSAALHLLEAGGDQAALAATFKKLDTIGEYNTAFMQLESGAVDAVALDLPVAKFQISGKEDKYTIIDEKLSSEHYAVAFKKGNTEQAEAVQKTLKEMVADGTVKKIAEKYADQGISYDMWILKA
ncbi:MAG: transporter substrate-binding domain-containing protein [Raoultibacter sp.]